jgi:hypothetical protein
MPVDDRGHRSACIVRCADGAGKSVVTVFLADLDVDGAEIGGRGLEPDERKTWLDATYLLFIVVAREDCRGGDRPFK